MKNTPLHLHCLFTSCGLRSVPLISRWDNHRPLIWSGPPGWGLAKVSHQQFPVVIDFVVLHQYSRDLMLVSAGPGPVYLASCTAHTNAADIQSADLTWASRTLQKKKVSWSCAWGRVLLLIPFKTPQHCERLEYSWGN